MATGLVARFRLAFSPGSQQQLENEAKQAGRKTATAYELGAAGGLQAFFNRIGGWLASAFAVKKIIDFAESSIKAANESESAWNELGHSLAIVGIKIDDVRGSLERLGKQFLDKTTFSDEAALRGLNTLVQITDDYNLSLHAVQVAADLAAAKHLELEDASRLVGRALEGNTRALMLMGITIKAGLPVLGQLNEQFGGAAQNQMNTYAGKLKQVANFWNELKEEIGRALIAAGGGTSVMDTLVGTLKGLATWVKQNAEQLRLFGNAVTTAADYLLRRLVPALEKASDTLRDKFSSFVVNTTNELIAFLSVLNFIENALRPSFQKTFLDVQIEKLKAFKEEMRQVGEAARENLSLFGVPGSQGPGASLRGGGSRPSVGSGPDFTAINVDRIAGDETERAKARAKWKEMLKGLNDDYEAALRDAKTATVGLLFDIEEEWKKKNKERLIAVRTATSDQLTSLKTIGAKVLEIAGEEAEANAKAREEQRIRDELARLASEKRLRDLGDEAQFVANIASEALNLADQFGIVDDNLISMLEHIQAIGQGVSDVVSGLTSGNLGQILSGAGSVVENLLGAEPGGTHDTEFQLEKLHQAALAGDATALRTLKIYGNLDPNVPSPWNKQLKNQWGSVVALQIASAAKFAQEVMDKQLKQKEGEQGKTDDAAQRAAEKAARDEADRKRADERSVEQQRRDFLGQTRANEEEGIRLRELAEEKQAQQALTDSAKGLSEALKLMVSQAVAAQAAAETMGETGVLGFDSPAFIDAKRRADRQFADAQKAVADALAKQAEAGGVSANVEAGFTVQRTVTETSAGRMIGELTTISTILDKTYNLLEKRLGTVWPLPGMENGIPGVGNITLNMDGKEVAKIVGAHQAGEFQLKAELSGNSSMPSH